MAYGRLINHAADSGRCYYLLGKVRHTFLQFMEYAYEYNFNTECLNNP